MIGERLRLAREACGLTQAELAELAEVTQGALSQIEAGRVLTPAPETVRAIANATGFPVKFFDLGPLPDLPEGNYRKQARGTSRADKQIRARARQIVELVQRSESVVGLPKVTITPVDEAKDAAEIEELVVEIRDLLGVGASDPIPNLMRAMERAGVIVVRLPGEMRHHDSFSAWPDYGFGGRPIVVLTGGHTGDRDRFTVGHELGHLVLHTVRRGVEPAQAEAEAHRFAGALLLPKEAAREAMKAPLTLRDLMGVKATYGISIAASARRAWDLKLIGHEQYKSLNRQISARQWKKVEPVDVPSEQPVVVGKIVAALGGDGSTHQRADRAMVPAFMLRSLTTTAMGEPAKLTHMLDRA